MTSNKFQGLVDASFSAPNENKNTEETNFPQEVSTLEANNCFNTKEASIPPNSQKVTDASHCPSHPEEELQFYCFNNGSLVCGQCLVSGNYTGMEIANLKKATEKIREKLNTISTQLTSRSQVSGKYDEDVKATETAIENAIDQYKTDLKSKMEELRQEINSKEQEILQKLNKMREERLKSIKRSSANSPSNNDDLKELEAMLAKESSKSNDLDLCRYYSKKAPMLDNPLTAVKENSSLSLQKKLDSFKSQDSQVSTKLKEDYQNILKALQNFGDSINKVQPEIKIDLNENIDQLFTSTRIKLKGGSSISYSENNNREPQSKIDLIRKYSSIKDEKPNTGSNLSLKLKNTSSYLNQISVERELSNRSRNETRLHTDTDKDFYNILTSNRSKTPPKSKKIDLIGAYKDQLAKISCTKEKSSSTRALKTEGDEDRSGKYRSGRLAAKNLVESILGPQPAKKATTPVHYSYNTFLDVKSPGKTVADLLLQSKQDASQTTKSGNRRNDYFSGADLDKIFSESKVSIREKVEQKSSNQLKSKLVSFNFKNIK